MEILTKASTQQLNCRLEDFLEKKCYSIEELNVLVDTIVSEYGKRSRKAILAVNTIFTEKFESHFNMKLPYTFGGGHFFSKDCRFPEANNDFNESEEIRVNPNWGYAFNQEEIDKYKHQDGTIYTNYGPDCSGYIMILCKLIGIQNNLCKNATNMRDGAVYQNELFSPLGKVYVLNSDTLETIPPKSMEKFNGFYEVYDETVYEVKAGDLIHRPGHIMLITKVDQKDAMLYTSEVKGGKYGLIRTRYTWEELYDEGVYSIISMDDFFENPEKVMGCYIK